MRRKRHTRTNHTTINDINLTNLIDVIMVVFIIYILITPLVDQGINVELPEASAHQLKTTETVTVTISEDGDTYIGNEKLTLSELKDKLLFKLDKKPDTGIVIKGDKGAAYGSVIRVLDELNSAGITKVGMATQAKE